MRYDNMIRGKFLSRPNRFIAWVEIDGIKEKCHVKNTGRLKELLIPGVHVWVQQHDNPDRKTKYSLITVEKSLENGETAFVNIDSQAPNQAAEEWLRHGADGMLGEISLIRREKKYGNSRFDLYIEAEGKTSFMEVKGVTLDDHGVARFPDAPTERGVKHVEELIACREAGYGAYLLFVIQMKGISHFEPNEITHPEFAEALRAADRMGVHIFAYDCIINADTMTIDKPVEVRL